MPHPTNAVFESKWSQASLFWEEKPASGDYFETFTAGARGWIANSRSPLPIRDGAAVCKGPWIVDANHAPPGAGYLHLLMHIHTLEERLHASYAKAAGMYPDDFIREKQHEFIHGGYSRNMTDLRVRVKLRGALENRGSRLTVLVQGQPDPKGPRANWVMTGQSFSVTSDWSEQEIVLSTDESQWTYLGSRHDLGYGYVPILEVLAEVNVSFIFILFPLVIEPTTRVEDKHRAWAGVDYEVRADLLPQGEVEFDYVWLRYPKGAHR